MVDRPVLPPRPVPTHAGPGGHIYGEIAFWVKGEEARLVKSRALNVFIRQGDRSNPELKQWLPLFEPVPIFFLDAEAAKGGPGSPLGFEPDDGTTVQVVRRTVCRLCEVLDTDLVYAGGRAVPRTAPDDLMDYLDHELAPGNTFQPDDPVTVYWVEYLPNEV